MLPIMSNWPMMIVCAAALGARMGSVAKAAKAIQIMLRSITLIPDRVMQEEINGDIIMPYYDNAEVCVGRVVCGE